MPDTPVPLPDGVKPVWEDGVPWCALNCPSYERVDQHTTMCGKTRYVDDDCCYPAVVALAADRARLQERYDDARKAVDVHGETIITLIEDRTRLQGIVTTLATALMTVHEHGSRIPGQIVTLALKYDKDD